MPKGTPFLTKVKSLNHNDEPNIEDFFRQKKQQQKENGHDEDSEESAVEEKDWTQEETYDGQLSVDVYQDGDSIIVKSTIAGVSPKNLDIALNNDMLTIKGIRKQRSEIDEDQYFYRECYWGGFSRSIILPVDVVSDKVEAKLEDGVLTVVLPKAKKSKATIIPVK